MPENRHFSTALCQEVWNQERAVEAARKVNSTNAPVEFVVHNGGHAYPNDAPEKIIAFFKQQARK